jgi:hypothetical protein
MRKVAIQLLDVNGANQWPSRVLATQSKKLSAFPLLSSSAHILRSRDTIHIHIYKALKYISIHIQNSNTHNYTDLKIF